MLKQDIKVSKFMLELLVVQRMMFTRLKLVAFSCFDFVHRDSFWIFALNIHLTIPTYMPSTIINCVFQLY